MRKNVYSTDVDVAHVHDLFFAAQSWYLYKDNLLAVFRCFCLFGIFSTDNRANVAFWSSCECVQLVKKIEQSSRKISSVSVFRPRLIRLDWLKKKERVGSVVEFHPENLSSISHQGSRWGSIVHRIFFKVYEPYSEQWHERRGPFTMIYA